MQYSILTDTKTVLLVAILLSRLMKTDIAYISKITGFVGIFLHELMHFIVGTITLARPSLVHVGSDRGSVTFERFTWYNAAPTAMAPLLLLPLAFYLDKIFFVFFPCDLLHQIIYLCCMSVIIENSIPSGQDFRVAYEYSASAVFILAIAGGVAYATLLR